MSTEQSLKPGGEILLLMVFAGIGGLVVVVSRDMMDQAKNQGPLNGGSVPLPDVGLARLRKGVVCAVGSHSKCLGLQNLDVPQFCRSNSTRRVRRKPAREQRAT